MESERQRKIGALLQRDLADILQKAAKDSGISGLLISVTEVAVTVDLMIANHKVKGVEDWYRPIYLSYRKSSTSVDAIVQVEELVKEIDPSTAYTLQQAAETTSE